MKRLKIIALVLAASLGASQAQAWNAPVWLGQALDFMKKHPVITTATIIGASTLAAITAHKWYKAYRIHKHKNLENSFEQADTSLRDNTRKQQDEKKNNQTQLLQQQKNSKEKVPYTRNDYSLPTDHIKKIVYTKDQFQATFYKQLNELFPENVTQNGTNPQLKIENNKSSYTNQSWQPSHMSFGNNSIEHAQATQSNLQCAYTFISAVCSNPQNKFDARSQDFINAFSCDKKESEVSNKIYWDSLSAVASNARDSLKRYNCTEKSTDEDMIKIKNDAITGAAQVYKIHLQIDYPYLINFLRDFIPFINNNRFGRMIEKVKITLDTTWTTREKDPVAVIVCYLNPLAGDKEQKNDFLQKLLQAIATRYKNLPQEAFLKDTNKNIITPRYNKQIKDFIYLAQNNGDIKNMYKEVLENKHFKGKIENVFTDDYVFLKGYEFDREIK